MDEELENRKILKDYAVPIGGALLLALLIRFFLLEVYRMPSRAMFPTLIPGDTLFVSKNSYGIRMPGSHERFIERLPNYGDVVVFEFPDEPGREYIKRVVGLPGDTIQIKEGFLHLNGKKILSDPVLRHQESQIEHRCTKECSKECARETLPNDLPYSVCIESPELAQEEPISIRGGHVFVISDLRAQAPEITRLKAMGEVPIALIRGKAIMTWLSIAPQQDHLSWFSRIRFDRMFKWIH